MFFIARRCAFIVVFANGHMLVKVNVYSCVNVHRCVHIGECSQLCTLRGTVPRYICHRVSIRANFRIFPPTNCDLLSCGHGDLSPAAAVFVQSSQAICPPQPANGKITLQILFYIGIKSALLCEVELQDVLICLFFVKS